MSSTAIRSANVLIWGRILTGVSAIGQIIRICCNLKEDEGITNMQRVIKTQLIAAAMIGIMTGLSVGAEEAPPQMPKPVKEHEFLKRLVGKWESVLEVPPDLKMDADAAALNGTYESKMLGEFWVVSEAQREMMGMPVHSITTIGYDPKKTQSVGTSVNSMSHQMVKFEGNVDKTGRILTMQCEVQVYDRPEEKSQCRFVKEVIGNDEIKDISQWQDETGEWVTIFTFVSKRVK